MPRLFLYTKDVQQITGKSRTSAQKLISKIKKEYNKNKYEQITVIEFCNYTGLDPGLVLPQLVG